MLKREEMTSSWSQQRSWISVSSIKIILAVRHIKLKHVFILFLHNRLQSEDSVCTVFTCARGSRFTGRPCCSCRRTGRQGGSRRRWRVGLLPQTAPTHWDNKGDGKLIQPDRTRHRDEEDTKTFMNDSSLEAACRPDDDSVSRSLIQSYSRLNIRPTSQSQNIFQLLYKNTQRYTFYMFLFSGIKSTDVWSWMKRSV